MRLAMLPLFLVLFSGCITHQYEAHLQLHVEGRVVNCLDDLPLEGVNILMNVATEQVAIPEQYLHTLSDGSGLVDAEVTLQYTGGGLRRPSMALLAEALEFEFVFDLEGYAPQYRRVPGSGMKPADGSNILQLGQICLEPSAADDLYLFTRGNSSHLP